tara:strand:- start:5639 stop:5884 length:246 start_codon:yes stop_codon:yes gene_type:complete
MMSEIEERVIVKIRQRAEVGEKKYNTTMERTDLTYDEWLQHLQEELLDACVYLEKLMSLNAINVNRANLLDPFNVLDRWFP